MTHSLTVRIIATSAMLLVCSVALGDEPPKPLLAPAGIWIMRYDSKLDGKLDDNSHGEVRWKIAVRNNRISGGLAEAKEKDPSDHRLAGEIAVGKPPIAFMRQDGPRGLVCYYSGKLVAENRVAGTWFDNRGNSGDFELAVERK